jgi:tetratricopeptide (TPR) repeat protein
MTHFFFSTCLEWFRKYEEAIAEVQKGELLAGARPDQVEAEAGEFRKALQTGGPKGYRQKNLEMTLKEYQQAGERGRYSPALDLAGAYANVGDNEKALEWLEKSYAERDGNLTLVESYPAFKGLYGDPRFLALLKRMGLPSY